tara:strand:- start:10505 stop:10786 length:282 start_codon:yes stop_codon:yes gene_type:complete
MNNKELNRVRKKLDKLDIRLINLIKSRTSLIKEVIKIKKYKNQIVDKKRIKTVLNNIKKLSIRKNIDPLLTKKIWSSMINSYIDYERRNFKKK